MNRKPMQIMYILQNSGIALIFFCKTCGRYYAIGLDDEHSPGIVKKYKNTSIMYVSGFSSVKNVGSRNTTKINVEKN